uniref:Beta_helix domain-containing protein n=1 Tax=Heterorhabditis bacteriophora TaxID=37862 RepID=A0A1I7XM01_HETBA
MRPKSLDSSVRIENNQFEQNAMNVVVKVRHLRGNAVPVLISRNNFLDNLAYSVVEVDVPKATVSGNFFNNVQSSCEIIRPVPIHSDSVLNHWGYDIEAEILSRICSINNSQLYESHMVDNMSSLLSNYIAETAKNPLPEFGKTYNQVKAMSKPYTIESDVTVKADEIVIIESGSHFDISSKVGFIIQERGKIYFNGTNKNPVWLYGASPWTGIVVKPGGTLVLNYVIIENASTGVWIDSDKVEIKGAMIINPTIHGVEITANSATEVDLGHSMVEQAGSTAVVVDERNSDIIIRDLVIKDSNGSGIDFLFPIGDIQIENVKVINASSFSIHLAESSPSSLHTVSIKNVSITNQAKGHAGLLISGSWIQNLTIDGSLFNNNSVPSLILGLECRDHPFLITIRNSLFTYNNDTVIHLHMGECAGLEMKDNLLEENNRNGEQGVLILKAQPKKMLDDILLSIKRNKFLSNHGEYVASLSMEESNKMSGIISENLFEDNLNSDAVLVVTSPYFHIINNTFSNPNSKYQTVLRGNSNWKFTASGNEWGSTIANDVEQRSHISSEMSIHSTPSSDTMGNALVEEMKKNATNIEIVTPLNMQCSHLNYCSNRGTCMGWSSVDCSQPLCRYDCSGHGKCVSKDECECDVGWTGDANIYPMQ